jgi:hypothetical protein
MGYQHHPKWVSNMDCELPRMQQLIHSGFSCVLPERDAEGRRITLCRFEKLDASYFNYVDLIRLATMVLDMIQVEEETQVAGFIFIIDASHTTFRHLMMSPISEMIYLVKSFFHALPIRFQGCFVINMPWFAVKLADIAKKLMSKKLNQRIHFVNSMEEFHAKIDAKLMPEEYGGTVPIADMVEYTNKLLIENSHKNLYRYNNFFKTNFKHCNI